MQDTLQHAMCNVHLATCLAMLTYQFNDQEWLSPNWIICLYLIRVAVVGNVDAGKSTLLGVLTHGELDNGRGMARQRLFRHKHEMESGRTSSVGNDILGFDSRGDVVNKPDTHGKECSIFSYSQLFNIGSSFRIVSSLAEEIT